MLQALRSTFCIHPIMARIQNIKGASMMVREFDDADLNDYPHVPPLLDDEKVSMGVEMSV